MEALPELAGKSPLEVSHYIAYLLDYVKRNGVGVGESTTAPSYSSYHGVASGSGSLVIPSSVRSWSFLIRGDTNSSGIGYEYNGSISGYGTGPLYIGQVYSDGNYGSVKMAAPISIGLTGTATIEYSYTL